MKFLNFFTFPYVMMVLVFYILWVTERDSDLGNNRGVDRSEISANFLVLARRTVLSIIGYANTKT